MSLTTSGHGHVVARLDGVRARCGGPSICRVCAGEKAKWEAEKKVFTAEVFDAASQSSAELLCEAIKDLETLAGCLQSVDTRWANFAAEALERARGRKS